MHPLRNILNRIFWDKRQNPEDYVLSFIHRGALGDVKTISLKKICEIGGSWFTYQDDSGRKTTIPFHRIMLLKNVQTGNVLWRKRVVQT
jgi:uncharacterized protein (UPF0248 family)